MALACQGWLAGWAGMLPHAPLVPPYTLAVTDHPPSKVLAAVTPRDRVVLLDERGRDVSSEDVARLLAAAGDDGTPLVFCIGGPFGHGAAVMQRAETSIRLSRWVRAHCVARCSTVKEWDVACRLVLGWAHPFRGEASGGFGAGLWSAGTTAHLQRRRCLCETCLGPARASHPAFPHAATTHRAATPPPTRNPHSLQPQACAQPLGCAGGAGGAAVPRLYHSGRVALPSLSRPLLIDGVTYGYGIAVDSAPVG
jgi:hypothetical protein